MSCSEVSHALRAFLQGLWRVYLLVLIFRVLTFSDSWDILVSLGLNYPNTLLITVRFQLLASKLVMYMLCLYILYLHVLLYSASVIHYYYIDITTSLYVYKYIYIYMYIHTYVFISHRKL